MDFEKVASRIVERSCREDWADSVLKRFIQVALWEAYHEGRRGEPPEVASIPPVNGVIGYTNFPSRLGSIDVRYCEDQSRKIAGQIEKLVEGLPPGARVELPPLEWDGDRTTHALTILAQRSGLPSQEEGDAAIVVNPRE